MFLHCSPATSLCYQGTQSSKIIWGNMSNKYCTAIKPTFFCKMIWVCKCGYIPFNFAISRSTRLCAMKLTDQLKRTEATEDFLVSATGIDDIFCMETDLCWSFGVLIILEIDQVMIAMSFLIHFAGEATRRLTRTIWELIGYTLQKHTKASFFVHLKAIE